MQSACATHQWGIALKAALAETALDTEAAETAKNAETASDMAAQYRRIETSCEGTRREPFCVLVGPSVTASAAGGSTYGDVGPVKSPQPQFSAAF